MKYVAMVWREMPYGTIVTAQVTTGKYETTRGWPIGCTWHNSSKAMNVADSMMRHDDGTVTVIFRIKKASTGWVFLRTGEQMGYPSPEFAPYLDVIKEERGKNTRSLRPGLYYYNDAWWMLNHTEGPNNTRFSQVYRLYKNGDKTPRQAIPDGLRDVHRQIRFTDAVGNDFVPVDYEVE